MANLIGCVGQSSTGKSHSVSTLNPKETFLISVSGKKLPMRGFDKKYIPFSNTTPDGNKLFTSNPDTIQKALSYINKKRSDIKNVIIDDRNTNEWSSLNSVKRGKSRSGSSTVLNQIEIFVKA